MVLRDHRRETSTRWGFATTIMVFPDAFQLAHLAVRLYASQADVARFQVRCRIVHTYLPHW